MGQTGFFDLERRLDALSAKGDPLETIKTTVPWEAFRADIEAVSETKPEEKKSNAGRKPYDAILKFKIVVLQSLYNLSDEQTEFLIRDRLSFMRFLDLGLEDAVPDATTIWLFREALVESGLIDKLFDRFSQHLRVKGYIARGSQVWADSAYRSAEIEAKLAAKGLKSRIHRRAARNRPLSQNQEAANTVRSKVRARVEHVFGHQENSMGRKIVRTIGMARARFKIGMMNLGYNMRRLVQLERVAAAPA